MAAATEAQIHEPKPRSSAPKRNDSPMRNESRKRRRTIIISIMRMQIGIFEVEISADTEADTEAVTVEVTEAGIRERDVAEVEVLVAEEEVALDGPMVSSKAKEVAEAIINT